MVDVDTAQQFLRDNHHAVLVTRRKDGRTQSSPVAVGVDSAGRAIVSTTATSAKARNLRRDPWAALCVLHDNFYGPWVQVEGPAEVVELPDALELLVDYYRRVAGEHPNWDEYRQAMVDQSRVLLRITIEHATGTAA
jgi:PPOX class probable F420-dependent enzyme